jgi:hypothetical protein
MSWHWRAGQYSTLCLLCQFLHFAQCLLSETVVTINDIYIIIYIFGYVSPAWNTDNILTLVTAYGICHSIWNATMTY